MKWSEYLATGPNRIIYHMCDVDAFNTLTAAGKLYYPPTYSQDGFIHATEDPHSLIEVANYFYKTTPGKWVCLSIDQSKLRSAKVIYEKPLPVGNIEAFDHKSTGQSTPQFPHIYGGLPKDSVLRYYKIVRSEDGMFLRIDGLLA